MSEDTTLQHGSMPAAHVDRAPLSCLCCGQDLDDRTPRWCPRCGITTRLVGTSAA